MTPQSATSEIGRLNRALTDLRKEKLDAGSDCAAMRKAMNEIRDLAHSGQIREMLAVIDNERAIYIAKRKPRKNGVKS